MSYPHSSDYASLWTTLAPSPEAEVAPNAVVSLLQRTGLPTSTLAAVWHLAKFRAASPGIVFSEFYLALRMCALCQSGATLVPGPEGSVATHVSMNLPLVQLGGGGSGAAAAAAVPSSVSVVPAMMGSSSVGGGGAALGAVLTECAQCSEKERAHYFRALQALGHSDFGQQMRVAPPTMRELFSRGGLPNEVLGQVWSIVKPEPAAVAAFAFPELVLGLRLLALAQCGRDPSIAAVLHEQTKPGGWAVPVVQFMGGAPPQPQQPPQMASPPAAAAPAPAAPATNADPFASIDDEPELTPAAAAPAAGGGDGLSAATAAAAAAQSLEWRSTYAAALFREIDCAAHGSVGGVPALGFFRRTQLPEPVLHKIWHLAVATDAASTAGRLTLAGFETAVRLVGVAQGSSEGSIDWLSESSPPPSADAVFATVNPDMLPPARFAGYDALLSALTPGPPGKPGLAKEKYAAKERVVYIAQGVEHAAEVIKVHRDDTELYFTIVYSPSSGESQREKQTIAKRLRPLVEGAPFGEEATFYDSLLAKVFAQGTPEAQASADAGGGVTGVAILPILQGAGLPVQVIRHLWMLLDNPPQGYLFRSDLYALFRLVALVCAGGDPTQLSRASALNVEASVAFSFKTVAWAPF